MAKQKPEAVITGIWSTKTVTINGREISLPGFIEDLKADAEEPGDNDDTLRDYCHPAKGFSWGDTSLETECLFLACCHYLNVKTVMCRFFTRELRKLPKADMHLSFTDKELDDGYILSENLFGQEFVSFMKELGAVPLLDLEQERTKPN